MWNHCILGKAENVGESWNVPLPHIICKYKTECNMNIKGQNYKFSDCSIKENLDDLWEKYF